MFTSLEGLENANSLCILLMNNSCIKEMTTARHFRNLVYLDISSSHLEDNIFRDISQIPLLQYLDASNNLVRNFPDLKTEALYELKLNGNLITSVKTGTNWLFNLRLLNLSQNQITDVAPFSFCPFLTELDLSDNLLKGDLVDVLTRRQLIPCFSFTKRRSSCNL